MIPTVEFNIIFQLTHIYSHLMNEGIGLRQLLDYYYVLCDFYKVYQKSSKTHPSSLTLKGGSTAFPKPLFNGLYTPFGSPVCGGQKPQGRRGKPPYSVLEPLRYKVGGPKRSRQIMRDGTARGGKAICKYLNFLIWIEVLKETGSSLL